MLITLIACLCFGTNVHAGSITPSTSAPTNGFDIDVELAKIAATCLTPRNYEQLTGNIVRHGVVRSLFGMYLVRESVATIGLDEMRAALGFAPPRPWQHFNDTKPSDAELSAAPTIEAYYELREPRSVERSLNSDFLLEHNVISAIAYLDERFPVIRTAFKRKFNPIRQQTLDRKIVDQCIEDFLAIRRKVNSAIRQMVARGEECLDVVD